MRQKQGLELAYAGEASARTEKDDLPLVMGEIAQIMGACAVALTMHPSGQHAPSLLYSDRDLTAFNDQAVLETASRYLSNHPDKTHVWDEGADGLGEHVMLIPVEPIPGHSRLVISIYFDGLAEPKRSEANKVYLQRRPFAIGYFRLWQVDRMRRQQCRVLESALHQTDTGVVLLARGGDVVFANAAAETMLSKCDGLRWRNDSVSGTNMAEAISLQVAINHLETVNSSRMSVVGAQTSPVLAMHREQGPPLIVSLLATDQVAIEPGDVAVIMRVVDPQLDTAKMLAPICRLYLLSPVETTLVCHLAQGKSLLKAAELMHVKELTARGYLKQIFLKTDTNRQTELVVLMLSSLVRMRDGVVQEALSVSVKMNGKYSSM